MASGRKGDSRGVTSKINTPGRRFEGFASDDIKKGTELSYRLENRRYNELEEKIERMAEKFIKFETYHNKMLEMKREVMDLKVELGKVREMNDKLQSENESLRRQLKKEMEEVRRIMSKLLRM